MNYDQEITRLIEEIKADKSLAQPWKNYASKELHVAQSLIRMAKTTTNRAPDNAPPLQVSSAGTGCTCVPGAVDRNCPTHGGK